MRAFYIAGILSVALPFAAIETANAGGIVSHNGGHSIRTASSDLLAGPGRSGRKNRGFRLFAPNVVAATTPSGAGTTALGGTLSLSGRLIKGGTGAFDWYTLSVTPTVGGTLSLSGGGISFLDGTTAAVGNVSGGTLSLWNGAVSGASGGEFHINRSGNGTPTVGGGLTLVDDPANTAGGTLQFRPTTGSASSGINVSNGTVGINPGAMPNSRLSNGVVISSGGTINFNGGGLLRVGSGTLTLAGGTVYTAGLNGELTGEAADTSVGMGAITLTGSSTINFFSGTGSNLIIHTLGNVISIQNWTGAGLDLGTNMNGGTLTFETSQTLEPLVIDANGGAIGIVNVGVPPAPGEDASSQSAQPVPEPSAAALLALSAAALLTRRARNRK